MIGAVLALLSGVNIFETFASTSEIQVAGCWGPTDPHCDNGTFSTSCTDGSHPYYCPNTWTYEIVDSVQLYSASAILSADHTNPLTITAGNTLDITSLGYGAISDPYQ